MYTTNTLVYLILYEYELCTYSYVRTTNVSTSYVCTRMAYTIIHEYLSYIQKS